jgi:hypothetical protein
VLAKRRRREGIRRKGGVKVWSQEGSWFRNVGEGTRSTSSVKPVEWDEVAGRKWWNSRCARPGQEHVAIGHETVLSGDGRI